MTHTHTPRERKKERRERERETVVGSCPLTAHPGGSGIPHAVAAINYCQLQLNQTPYFSLLPLSWRRYGRPYNWQQLPLTPVLVSSFLVFIILLVYMTVNFTYEMFFSFMFFFFLFSFSSIFLSLIDFSQGNRMKQKQKELDSV